MTGQRMSAAARVALGALRRARNALNDVVKPLSSPFIPHFWPVLVHAHRIAGTAAFRQAADEVRQACELLQIDPPAGAVDAALRRIVWTTHRTSLVAWLARARRPQIERWFALDGVDVLERARRDTGGVVVLSSHFGVARGVPVILARLGYGVFSFEGGRRHLLAIPNLEQKVIGRRLQPFPLKELYLARKALEGGRLLHILGDAQSGASERVRRFCGRLRPFRLGFAQLAVDSGAAVVPVFATLVPGGRTRIEFLPPLEAGTADTPCAERVNSLVDQYARLLEHRWRTGPGELRSHTLALHRGFPSALADATAGGSPPAVATSHGP